MFSNHSFYGNTRSLCFSWELRSFVHVVTPQPLVWVGFIHPQPPDLDSSRFMGCWAECAIGFDATDPQPWYRINRHIGHFLFCCLLCVKDLLSLEGCSLKYEGDFYVWRRWRCHLHSLTCFPAWSFLYLLFVVKFYFLVFLPFSSSLFFFFFCLCVCGMHCLSVA